VNTNGIPDECEDDCNNNNIPDDWDIFLTVSADCNSNGIPDECDIADLTSVDVNSNGIPDECEPDCDGDSVPDAWAVSQGQVGLQHQWRAGQLRHRRFHISRREYQRHPR
jgi:hypothetical protein